MTCTYVIYKNFNHNIFTSMKKLLALCLLVMATLTMSAQTNQKIVDTNKAQTCCQNSKGKNKAACAKKQECANAQKCDQVCANTKNCDKACDKAKNCDKACDNGKNCGKDCSKANCKDCKNCDSKCKDKNCKDCKGDACKHNDNCKHHKK